MNTAVPDLTPMPGSPATLVPILSAQSWLAAQGAAERAIPVLVGKGFLEMAAHLARRATQFGQRAAG